MADLTKLAVEVEVEAVHGKNLCQHTLAPGTSGCCGYGKGTMLSFYYLI